MLGRGSSPIVAAVVHEVVRAQAHSTPDGAPAVPYIFFVVRPDGIRPYYKARARLEPLGIAFGYELVDQDMEIDYPDLDNLDEWDGSAPLQLPLVQAPVADAARGPLTWPGERHRAATEGESPESFVWPTRPPGRAGTSAVATPGGEDRFRRCVRSWLQHGGGWRRRGSSGPRTGRGPGAGRPSLAGRAPGRAEAGTAGPTEAG